MQYGEQSVRLADDATKAEAAAAAAAKEAEEVVANMEFGEKHVLEEIEAAAQAATLNVIEYLESARGDVRSPSLTAGEGAGSSQAAPSDGPSPVPQLTQDNAVAVSKLVREIELNLTFSTGRREPELNTLPHNKKRTPPPPPPPSVSPKESSFVLDDYLQQLTGRSGAKLHGDVLETVFVDGEAVHRMVKRNLH